MVGEWLVKGCEGAVNGPYYIVMNVKDFLLKEWFITKC